MTMQRLWHSVLTVLVVSWCGFTVVHAQTKSPPPVVQLNGYAGEATRAVRNRDIGTGYSGASLNSIALQNARGNIQYVGQSSTASAAGGARLGLGIGGAGGGSKPFSNFSPSPTVSPYLNLFNDSRNGNTDFNYQTLVRPQLQQQQFNQQSQSQAYDLSRRLQQISAQADYNPEGSKTQYPTGHQTVFQYHGHFYPQPAAPRRKQ
jgi:hypothetical protein